MKTVRCISQGELNRVPGSKVVNLADWKADHFTELDKPEIERTRPRRRRRTRRPGWTARDWAELAATLAVAAAFIALAARVLL